MTQKEKPLAMADQAHSQGAIIKACNLITDDTPSTLSGQPETYRGNSINAQQQRVLNWLRQEPLTTFQAREILDVPHPAGRVRELRKMGHLIETLWVNDISASGQNHRVAKYILQKTETHES